MAYYEKIGDSLYCYRHGETVRISPWGENSLRVTARVAGEFDETEFALSEHEKTDAQIIIEDGSACVKNGKISVRVWGNDNNLTFINEKDEVLLQEFPGFIKARSYNHLAGNSYALTVTFKGNDNEHIYGMGQAQNGILDLKGATIDLMQRNTQISVPFLISSLGYGFLWNNPAIGKVSFSKDRTIWTAESCQQMDYYITAGDTPAEISYAYAKATGFVPMAPEYGLGFWQCKLRYASQEEILSVAREYKRRNIPIDVIVCDFFHWPHCGDFRFDEEFFPDPEAMVRELKEMGIELMVSVWTESAMRSENYNEYKDKGYLVSLNQGYQVTHRFVEDSLMLDFTNAKARECVWGKIKKNYFDNGINVYWLDNAEPDFELPEFSNYNYWLGNGQEVSNIYPKYFLKMIYDGINEATGKTEQMHLIRSAWAGSQKYGALAWSGDVISTWESFRKQLPAGLNIGVAGIPWWNTDLGGFHGGNINDPKFRELLIRWFQWGAYCPVMRIHGTRDPGKSVRRKDGTECLWSGADNEVWSYGEDVEKILVKYINRRESMRDYIRETMRQAHETGKPVMRAMWYVFGDPECTDMSDEYMFGDKYLVAPVYEPGAVTRKVYFPAGTEWKDVDTGICYKGGQYAVVDAPIERIPVFELI